MGIKKLYRGAITAITYFLTLLPPLPRDHEYDEWHDEYLSSYALTYNKITRRLYLLECFLFKYLFIYWT